ncbi:DUF1801 domain-containing protein [Planctomycetota bacterium]
MGSSKRNPDVDNYISKLNSKIQPIVRELRSLMFKAVPDFEEKLKYSIPTYLKNGVICNIAAYAGHVNLGFTYGAYLEDSGNLLEGTGKYERHIKIKTKKEVNRDYIIALIRQATSLFSDTTLPEGCYNTAKDILIQAGMRAGHNVLDFGSGDGNYTIPAASIVGNSGKVYALDKDKRRLNRLVTKAASISNIHRLDTKGQADIPLPDNSVDMVLLFDVSLDNPKDFLKEFQRVLIPRGHLVIYLPIEKGRDQASVKKSIANIKRAGFILKKQVEQDMAIHWKSIERGTTHVFKCPNKSGSNSHYSP